jgi:hypothetical protein
MKSLASGQREMERTLPQPLGLLWDLNYVEILDSYTGWTRKPVAEAKGVP